MQDFVHQQYVLNFASSVWNLYNRQPVSVASLKIGLVRNERIARMLKLARRTALDWILSPHNSLEAPMHFQYQRTEYVD